MRLLIALTFIFGVACSSAKKVPVTPQTPAAVETNAPKAAGKDAAKAAPAPAGKKAAVAAKAAPAAKTESATTTAATEGKVECVSGEVKRTLELKKTEPSGCELLYTKDGETKSVANAVNESGYCEGVMAKIQKTLTDSGFTCQ